MSYDQERHHRRSIRLKGYGYAQAGAYFVTIVTQDRACLFGEVMDGVVAPSEAGLMVQTVWNELSVFYPGVDVDAFVVMPNHVHGIVVLDGMGVRGGGEGRDFGGGRVDAGPGSGQAQGPAPTNDAGVMAYAAAASVGAAPWSLSQKVGGRGDGDGKRGRSRGERA